MNVLYYEPHEDGDVLVKMGIVSAMLAARDYWFGYVLPKMIKRNQPLPCLTASEILEEWMIMQWAWFDLGP